MTWIEEATHKLLWHAARIASRRVITRFDRFASEEPRHAALLSYLVLPLLPFPDIGPRSLFNNWSIAREIPRALNQLGYAVDIVNYDNISWTPSRRYDLFIGHGGINFERLSRLIHPDAVRIYFSTGIYWRELNARLAARIKELALRKRCALPLYRSVSVDEEYANAVSDGIICLGNHAAARTYSKFPLVATINNLIPDVHSDDFEDKDYGEARKHFLFFSGPGNVLKGLDLLLEIFSRTDLHLHVCQHVEPSFGRIYHRELTQLPNIHVHGVIAMRSLTFRSLISRCNWIISATCTEGQPGAVLECMAHGLIPILPITANIDLEEWGILLPNIEPNTILSAIIRASEMTADECGRRAVSVMKKTRMIYSIDNFRLNFQMAVRSILEVVDSRDIGPNELIPIDSTLGSHQVPAK